MEKLIEQIKSIRGNSLTEYGENKVLAEQSRSLAIEFAEWNYNEGWKEDFQEQTTHTTSELFDLFLSQKQF